MRTLVDIPEEDIRSLDELAARSKRSRAAEIREAVEAHLRAKADKSWIEEGAGYWKHRTDISDGLTYQDKVRNSREPLS